MKDGLLVRGLNTVATLWCSAAIGILTSSGFISYAIIGTLFILTANIFLRHLAQSLLRSHDVLHKEQIEYQIRIISNRGEDQHIRTFILQETMGENSILLHLESSFLEDRGLVQILAQVVSTDREHRFVENIVDQLSQERGIISVGWEVS